MRCNIKWSGVNISINKKNVKFFPLSEKPLYLLQKDDVLIMEGELLGNSSPHIIMSLRLAIFKLCS